MSNEVENNDDDAEYESHFNEFAGGKPANTEDVLEDRIDDEEEQEQEQSNDTDDAGDASSDDEADDKAPAKETAEAKYKRELDEWKHKYNSDIGRVNAYQRQIAEQKEQLKKFSQTSSNPPADADMSSKEWEELKQDYPDIAKGFESQINAIKAQSTKDLEYLRGQIQPLEQQQQEQYRNMQMQQLQTNHPDWRDVVQTAEFGSWLNNQPEEIQAFMQSQDAQRNIYLLNSYKSATQPQSVAQNNGLQQKRQKQLQQAQTVANRSTSNSRDTLSSDDYDAAFAHYAKQKDRR